MPSVDVLGRLHGVRPGGVRLGGEREAGPPGTASPGPDPQPTESGAAARSHTWENPALKQATAFVQDCLRRDCADLLRSSVLSQEARVELRLRIRQILAENPALAQAQTGLDELVDQVYDYVAGLGPLQPLVDRPEISEIMVNRWDDVWIEQDGRLVREPAVRFRDDLHVFYVTQRVLGPIGVPFSAATPLASGRLPGNIRVAAAMPPAGPHCTLNIRKPALPVICSEDYVRRGTAAPQMLALLQAAARGRANLLIAGPTGTGKSTLLRYCGQYFPASARILVMEQVAELGLERYHPHVVSFECQPERPGLEDTYGMEDLLIHALHRRPDYIVVGEIRGPESLQLLMAMATGHPGAATVHAESPQRLFDRIALAILQCRLQVSLDQLLRYLAEAVHLVAYIERMTDGSRKITHLAEITGFKDGNPVLHPLWQFEPDEVTEARVTGRFMQVGQMTDSLAARLRRWGVDLSGLDTADRGRPADLVGAGRDPCSGIPAARPPGHD